MRATTNYTFQPQNLREIAYLPAILLWFVYLFIISAACHVNLKPYARCTSYVARNSHTVTWRQHSFLWIKTCDHFRRLKRVSTQEKMPSSKMLLFCPLESPAMGHWGTSPPPRLPAILGITRFTDWRGFLSSRTFSGHRFCRGKFKLCHFFCPQFSSGSNYSSQNAGTIANKFQLHTYFRFR